MLPYLTALFVLFWQWNSQRHWWPVFWGRRLKRSTFFRKKCTRSEKILAMPMPPQHSASVPPNVKSATPMTAGDLAWGFSDLEMTWLFYCACAATGVCSGVCDVNGLLKHCCRYCVLRLRVALFLWTFFTTVFSSTFAYLTPSFVSGSAVLPTVVWCVNGYGIGIVRESYFDMHDKKLGISLP